MKKYYVKETFSIGKDTYAVKDANTKDTIYEIKGRLVDMTRTKLKIIDKRTNDRVGTIVSIPLSKKWKIKKKGGSTLATVRFGGTMMNKIKVRYGGQDYVGRSFGRRNFDIKRRKETALEIHKKGLMVKDAFYVDDHEIFDEIVAVSLAVLIDQRYHE